ncbi:MAG: response regulator [Oscillospiraceae bacterium]|nr:response regulator [Oscillospiraceae bacterium]
MSAKEKNFKILLVEDDINECKAIAQYADKVGGVRIVDITNNIERALTVVVDCMPDAIILDIELHRGHGNGLLFMEKLNNKTEIVFRPYILVTTNNSSQITHDYARGVGADFIMSKYQEDYSAESVIDFLLSMRGMILFRKRKQGLGGFMPSAQDEKRERIKRMTRRLHSEFDLIGISHKILGRKYLVDAVLITAENHRIHAGKEVATLYKKTVQSCDRAMTFAINSTWKTTDIEDLRKHYTAKISAENGSPTLSEFLHYYAERVRENEDYDDDDEI